MTRELFDMPQEIAALPRDHRGYPVPKFASWHDGKPNFVLVDRQFFADAINNNLCWVCGGRLGKRLFFVTGPMCTITGISAEPPCHMGCATFAAKNCPFLTQPLAKRIDPGKFGVDYQSPGGEMVERNPGVTALCEVRDYKIIKDARGNPLIKMNDFTNITWWREGRPARGEEVIEAIQTGLPALWEMAASEGPIAQYELQQLVDLYVETTLKRFLPVTSQSKQGA